MGDPYFLNPIIVSTKEGHRVPVSVDIRLQGSALTLKVGRLEFADPAPYPYQLGHLGLLIGTSWLSPF